MKYLLAVVIVPLGILIGAYGGHKLAYAKRNLFPTPEGGFRKTQFDAIPRTPENAWRETFMVYAGGALGGLTGVFLVFAKK